MNKGGCLSHTPRHHQLLPIGEKPPSTTLRVLVMLQDALGQKGVDLCCADFGNIYLPHHHHQHCHHGLGVPKKGLVSFTPTQVWRAKGERGREVRVSLAQAPETTPCVFAIGTCQLSSRSPSSPSTTSIASVLRRATRTLVLRKPRPNLQTSPYDLRGHGGL